MSTQPSIKPVAFKKGYAIVEVSMTPYYKHFYWLKSDEFTQEWKDSIIKKLLNKQTSAINLKLPITESDDSGYSSDIYEDESDDESEERNEYDLEFDVESVFKDRLEHLLSESTNNDDWTQVSHKKKCKSAV